MNINYHQLYDDVKKHTSGQFKTTSGLTAVNLNHLIPILACIVPVEADDYSQDSYLAETIKENTSYEPHLKKFSVSKTIARIKETDDYTSINGDFITGKEMIKLIFCLYKIPRSFFVSGMVKNPLYATLTPLVLYALKDARGIKYEQWNKDKDLSWFLGIQLSELLEIRNYFNLTGEQVNSLRKTALTVIKTGELKALTSNKMNLGNIHNKMFPKIAIFMLLQTWLANAECRNTDSMILDPFNWDNIPEAIDYVEEKEVPDDDLPF